VIELRVGHAVDRGAKRAAWAAMLRTVIDGEIVTDFGGTSVPTHVHIASASGEHTMPCSAEAAVLYALTVALDYDTIGIALGPDADGAIRVLTDLAPVAAFLRGEAPLSAHVVLRGLQDTISDKTRTPIRNGRMVLPHSPRPKGRSREEHLERWLADAQLVPPRELRSVRQIASTVLANWEPRTAFIS
jgi:hypothetical protein